MKIALIHYRLILRGGLETRLINYANYYHKQGHEVTIVFAKKSNEVNLPPDIQQHRIYLGFMLKPFRQRYFNYLLGKYFKKHHFDFRLSLGRTSHQDAVLAPGNHIGFLNAEGKTQYSWMDKQYINLDRLAYEKSQFILAASKMMKEEVIDYFGIAKEKVSVVYPPLNTFQFKLELKQKQNVYRQQFDLGLYKKSFLFISTGHKRKGLPLLLEAFKMLQNEPVELIIAGYPKVNSDLPNVKFIGFIKEPQYLYAAVDAVLHPSYYEPYGQIVAESIACGTPVIISDNVGAKEIVSDNEGLVIHSFDPKEWSRRIKQFNPSQYAISSNFAVDNGIDIQNHMQSIASFCTPHIKL